MELTSYRDGFGLCRLKLRLRLLECFPPILQYLYLASDLLSDRNSLILALPLIQLIFRGSEVSFDPLFFLFVEFQEFIGTALNGRLLLYILVNDKAKCVFSLLARTGKIGYLKHTAIWQGYGKGIIGQASLSCLRVHLSLLLFFPHRTIVS